MKLRLSKTGPLCVGAEGFDHFAATLLAVHVVCVVAEAETDDHFGRTAQTHVLVERTARVQTELNGGGDRV